MTHKLAPSWWQRCGEKVPNSLYLAEESEMGHTLGGGFFLISLAIELLKVIGLLVLISFLEGKNI